MSLAQPNLPDSSPQPLRVGTRASPLALWQARHFIDIMTRHCAQTGHAGRFVEEHIRTTGDRVQNVRLAEIGGKGLFAKEIHEAMLERRIDLAVHSLKDLETALPPGIVLACTLTREDARDALILGPRCASADEPFECLPAGAVIGTSSVRRQSQLLHRRPDLKIALLRGNVQTRLDRTQRGDFDASLLAMAGLKRLGLAESGAVALDSEAMVPAACQGIVGITARAGDTDLLALLDGVACAEARAVSTAERAMLAFLDGSCRTPIGGHARLLPDGRLHLTGLVARPDGSFLVKRSVVGLVGDAVRMGAELGAELRADSPGDVFA